jgi:hypothetical protein
MSYPHPAHRDLHRKSGLSTELCTPLSPTTFAFVSARWEVSPVSIAELPNNSSRANSSYNNIGTEFERTPPQDLIAEQSVLGGMLLSKDAIADVLEILRERDFYRPAHELNL